MINILAPIFGLIALAYLSRKVNVLGPSAYVELNRYVASLALPALIFDNVAHVTPSSLNRPGFVASFIVVGVMAVIALGFLEPANIAVLVEMRKDDPDGEVIGKLMKRFVYTAGITGMMQIATLVIMTRIRTN